MGLYVNLCESPPIAVLERGKVEMGWGSLGEGNPMNGASIAAIVYGVLVLGGGVMGYAQAGSQVSLISGVISGSLLVLGGLLPTFGQGWGVGLSLIVTTVLVITFTIRLYKTRKFMPAGLMVILGIATLIFMLQATLAPVTVSSVVSLF